MAAGHQEQSTSRSKKKPVALVCGTSSLHVTTRVAESSSESIMTALHAWPVTSRANRSIVVIRRSCGSTPLYIHAKIQSIGRRCAHRVELTPHGVDRSDQHESEVDHLVGVQHFAGVRIGQAAVESERREPRAADEAGRLVPQLPRLSVAVGDDQVAQVTDAVAERPTRLGGVKVEQRPFALRMQRRQDRRDAFARAPADAVFRRRERLEDRRMRLLQRLRHDADRGQLRPFRNPCRKAATLRGPTAFRGAESASTCRSTAAANRSRRL